MVVVSIRRGWMLPRAGNKVPETGPYVMVTANVENFKLESRGADQLMITIMVAQAL